MKRKPNEDPDPEQGKQSRLLRRLAVASLLLGTGFCVWRQHHQEPMIGEKPVSVWLEDLDTWNGNPTADTASAVHQMGSSALPWMMEWIQAEDSPAKRRWIEQLNKLPFLNLRFTSASVLRRRALKGFTVLGPAAGPSIPELVLLASEGNQEAKWALTQIGREGVWASQAVGPRSREILPDLLRFFERRERDEQADTGWGN